MTNAEPVAPETNLPPLPATPPASPRLPGAPAAVPAPAPVPKPPPPAPAAAKPSGPSVGVAFARGSALLPSDADAAIKALADQRGDGRIIVVGYGEASTNDPAAQQKALQLALSRAQSIAGALAKAGVPADHIQIDAQASGSGAAARVIN